MKNRFINIVLITIIFFLVLSISLISALRRHVYNELNIQTEKEYLHKNKDKTPIYEKIGVSKRCLYVWQVLTAEGFWPNPEPPGCSQEDIDKIDEYCENITDTCYNYDIDDI